MLCVSRCCFSPRLRGAIFRRLVAVALASLVAVTASAQLQKPTPAVAPVATPAIVLLDSSPYFATPTYIRSGVPITFTGRILPADATGTLTFSVDGTPVQTSTLSTQRGGNFIAVGDSITYAGYIADPSQRYQSLVAHAFNLDASTYASPGYTACDAMLYNVVPNGVGLQTGSNPLYGLLIGANEVLQYGLGGNEALFNLCDQAALSWLGTSRASKILIGDSGVAVLSGSWTSAGAFGACCINALTTTAGSGTVRFTMTTNGGAAYLWYLMQAGESGSFSVSVDGGPAGTATSTLFPPTTLENIAGSYALLRIPAAAGTHTFDINALSGTVGVLAMGTAPAAGFEEPTVLASDVPNNQVASTAATVAGYTAEIQADINLLRADGLDLRFVPTQQYMFATPAEMMDTRHPNALGLSEIAAAFESVVTPAVPASGNITSSTATFTTSTLALGVHNIGISSSGDNTYAAASTGIGPVVLYDPTSTVSLSASASIVPAQTPVNLIAAIPNSNASGSVTFFDVSGPSPVALGSAWIGQVSLATAQLTLASLAVGQHTLMAQYAGDVLYNGSSSATIVVTVSGPGTATTLSAPATRYFAGSPVALSATVTPAFTTGAVTFLDGTSVLAHVAIVSGSASFTSSSLAPGVHTLTASFNGNATQNPSQSPILAIEIDPNPTTIALATLPMSVAYGSGVALKASVSPASATGSVVFNDSFAALAQAGGLAPPQSLGQSALSSGVATLNSATLAPGTHTLAAVYAGDALDLPSVSSALVLQVTLASSATTLAPIPGPATYGTPIALTASVAPSAATGTITFTDSVSGILGQAALANGTASFSAANLAPGLHTLSATYSGDSFRSTSTSTALSITVNPASSSVTLAALSATNYVGSPLTLSANISPASATGTVVFRDATLGVLGESAVAHGVSALTLANPALGAYSITATYSGDTDDTSSTSAAITTQVVLNPTSTTLNTSANPASLNSPLTFSAAVNPASATGIVTLLDGTSSIATAPVVSGKASITLASLSGGLHSLRASYGGDSLNAPSTSAVLAETVSAAATTTSLTLAQSSVVAGSPLTFNVRVTSAYAAPGGTVTVRSGTTVLTSGPLANASGGAGYATLTSSSTLLGLGTFPITASYSGDANDLPSDSSANPASLTILGIPVAVVLTPSATSIPVQGTDALTATITSSSATPTGSVTFLSNGSTLAIVPLNASGTALYTWTSAAVGTYAISAVFTPSGLFAAASAASQSLIVTPPLSAALNLASTNLAPGGTQAATLTITPLSGFAGTIQSICQTTVTFISCSMNAPASIFGIVTVPVQVAVVQNTAAFGTPSRPGLLAVALLLPLLMVRRSKRTLRLLGLLLIASLAGCAEGGNFSFTPASTQRVAITITAAGMPYTASLVVNVTQ